MNARTAHRSSGFSGFFFGLLLALVAVGAAITWFGVQGNQVIRTADLKPSISIPVPDLPPPPNVIPDTGQAPRS